MTGYVYLPHSKSGAGPIYGSIKQRPLSSRVVASRAPDDAKSMLLGAIVLFAMCINSFHANFFF